MGATFVRRGIIAIIVVASVLLLASTYSTSKSTVSSNVVAFAASCDYDDNLNELAQSFIGRCCLGSVNREFPDEYLRVSLATIKSDKNNSVGNAIKAFKLLNDNRFRK